MLNEQRISRKEYPETVPCLKHSMIRFKPCDGTARRYETPLFAGREGAGP